MNLALGAAWIVGTAAVLQLVSIVVGRSPLAAALAGAVIADVAAARAGVRWDNIPPPTDKASSPNRRTLLIARHVGVGAGLGALVALLTLLAALGMGWVHVEVGHPSVSLALALVRTSAVAIRDELVLSGIGLAAAARAGVAPRFAIAFAALAHGAVVLLVPGSTPAAFALAVGSGALFASLWHRYQAAWPAVAASAAWSLCAGAVLRGGLLDATWVGGALVVGARASGRSAWLAAVMFVGITLLAAPIRRAFGRSRAHDAGA